MKSPHVFKDTTINSEGGLQLEMKQQLFFQKNIWFLFFYGETPFINLLYSEQDMLEKKKVVVVGGGLSGLSAAEELLKQQPNLDVTVLEAMDRVGGRTWSVQHRGAVFDLGGMWVGPHQKHVLDLISRSKCQLLVQPRTGLKILQLSGTPSTYPTDIPNNINILGLLHLKYILWRINRLANTVPLRNPSTCPNSTIWDSMTVYTWINQNIYFEKVKKMLEMAVRGIFGVDVNEISMLFFLWYVHQNESIDRLINIHEGCQEKKMVQGSQYLSKFLQKEVEKRGGKVVLGVPVKEVNQTQGGVDVVVRDGRKYQADYLIMAMPPVSLNRIVFTPRLSLQRQMINQKTFMGSTIKAVVLYEKAFWKDKNFSGQIVSDCKDSPVYNVYDDIRPKQNGQSQPALIVFINSGISRHWGDKQTMNQRIIDKLAEYFGQRALTPLKIHTQNWSNEEYIRGGPVANYPTGVLSQVGDICQPEGRIHWAGTETANVGQGYMDGAIQSGIRAAKEVIGRLNNSGKSGKTEVAGQKEDTPKYFGFITSYKRWFNRFI